ncbi:PREDICTED: spermatogenesis-associated protein 9 [Propithecus coquereli]|uniref:spermatogenesis-associated protein 9 n=1 Tax=Propithecus coquereli TaxID=379532 RepID=UPI00063FD02E|nr:PREDICTED: spermatogenesis-associated protein 9 [Propithecus coquereli]
MPIKPIGWICGQVLKNFSGRIEGIQKVIMDLVDEFKDEFPTILRLSQSNQKRGPTQKTPKLRMAIALSNINRGTLIRGLSSISRSSKSVAELLQPQLSCRLLELRDIACRLLREVNAPRQPLYNMQAACINAVLEKVKNIIQEEESIRQNREENENFRKAFSEPVLSEPMFPDGEIKVKPYRSLPEKPDNISDHLKLPFNKQSNKIQVLHSVFDQPTETNE